ncbi:DUF6462 family protein [Butyrivibrio sp.]|uniref:DUF6462 family protein n=1 Tax=Butyrivibrio sp. TaxID=28121 RepID=UPI0025BBB54E|nr:DUF6462 family protein [Butyrivibrio sp.]MBQ9302792.1 hypothetical protein [Butyrivibrio sp.]
MLADLNLEGLEALCEGKFKKLPQCMNPAREKYVRKTDASLVYPFGRHTIDNIAKKAGAIIEVKGCIAYDTDAINRYLDNMRLPAEM